jgi:hypothetical protein
VDYLRKQAALYYLSRLTKWVTVLLLEPRTRGRHSGRGGNNQPPGAGQRAPLDWRPDAAAGRVRRSLRRGSVPSPASWQPQPRARGAWFAPQDWEDSGTLVRPYVTGLSNRSIDRGLQ